MASNAPAIEDRHAYNQGVGIKRGSDGRTYVLCRCGAPRNSPQHRGMQPRALPPPLTAADRHPFRVKLGLVKIDARGAHDPLCADCGRVRNSPRHRGSATGDIVGGQALAIPVSGAAPVTLAPAPLTPVSHNHGYAVESPDRHPYAAGGGAMTDRRGRVRPLCLTCHGPQNSPRHRGQTTTGAVVVPTPTAPVKAAPVAPVIPPAGPRVVAPGGKIRVPTAELALLAIAIDQLLALPGDAISWRLRVQLTSLRGSVPVPQLPTMRPGEQLDPDNGAAPTMAEVVAKPELVPSTPITTGTGILRGIRNDKVRTLATRALADGWEASKTGSGHLMLARGQRRVVLSMTNTSRGGHWWQNVRAEARRAGIDVAGL